jgi:hypothetical protein
MVWQTSTRAGKQARKVIASCFMFLHLILKLSVQRGQLFVERLASRIDRAFRGMPFAKPVETTGKSEQNASD